MILYRSHKSILAGLLVAGSIVTGTISVTAESWSESSSSSNNVRRRDLNGLDNILEQPTSEVDVMETKMMNLLDDQDPHRQQQDDSHGRQLRRQRPNCLFCNNNNNDNDTTGLGGGGRNRRSWREEFEKFVNVGADDEILQMDPSQIENLMSVLALGFTNPAINLPFFQIILRIELESLRGCSWHTYMLGEELNYDNENNMFFPDTAANYFATTFHITDIDVDKIIIRGEIPNARYFSFQTYSFTASGYTRTIGGLRDDQITYDEENGTYEIIVSG